MFGNAADTLRADTAMLNAWRADSDYDYAREIVQSDFSLREWIMARIDDFMSALFGSNLYNENRTAIWLTIGFLLLAAIAVYVFRKHPALFGRSGKTVTNYEVTEDTIYGIDFPAMTDEAMRRQDYREVVRLTYLHALKELSDNGRIDWQPYKTPTQYAREVGTVEFRAFSNHFLRVRYGNFEATRELAEEMMRQRTALTGTGGGTMTKGGER